jgi:hypothetical protein
VIRVALQKIAFSNQPLAVSNRLFSSLCGGEVAMDSFVENTPSHTDSLSDPGTGLEHGEGCRGGMFRTGMLIRAADDRVRFALGHSKVLKPCNRAALAAQPRATGLLM